MPLFSTLKNKFKKPANDDEAVKVCPKCQKNPCACNDKASNGGNQVRMSPTGLPLPPCDRPLVSYYGSPYALAPDTICQFPEDIGEPIPIAQMEAHIKHLMNPVCQFGPVTFDGFDVEFKYLETLEAKRPPLDFTSAQLEPNILKNRYGNILPPEHTRVPLTLLNDDPNSHYINANYVSNKRYIASQGPLPTTFVDFWRLIWEQKVGVILMLTREIESGVTKCARYWPEKQGNLSPLAHAGGIQVRAITDDDLEDENSSEENDENSSSSSSNSASNGEKNGDAHAIPNNNIANYQQNTDKARQSAAPLSGNKQLTDEEFVTFDGANVSPEERESDLIDESIETRYGDIVVRFCGYRNGDEFVVRLMEMFRNGEKRRITQLQYTGWPDHGVPASAQGFVTLSRLADVANEQNSKFSGTDENDFVPPLLVHCSAGVGRTGTFMVVHSLLEQVRGTDAKHQNDIEPISVVDTLYQMRGQRPNSVQTKEQFRFCYQSLYSQIEHHLDDAGVAIEKVAKDENKATNSSNNKNNDDNDDESTNSQSETSSSASSTSSSNVSKNTNENSNNKPPEPDDDAPPATNKGRPHEPRRKSSSSRHRSHRSRGKAAIFVDIDNNNEDSSSFDQTPASPRTQEVRDRERRLRRAARDRRTHRSRHRSRYRDGERESSRYERSSKSTRSPGSRGTRHRRGSEERRHSRHRSSRR